jgi:hypothetical protein
MNIIHSGLSSLDATSFRKIHRLDSFFLFLSLSQDIFFPPSLMGEPVLRTPLSVAKQIQQVIARGEDIEPLVAPLRINAPLRAFSWMARHVGLNRLETDQAVFNRRMLAAEVVDETTVIYCAIQRRHLLAVQALWTLDPEAVSSQQTCLGDTLLHLCAWEGRRSIFRWLLEQSSMTKQLETRNAFGLTALQVAYLGQDEHVYYKWREAVGVKVSGVGVRPPSLAIQVVAPLMRSILLMPVEASVVVQHECAMHVRHQLEDYPSMLIDTLSIDSLVNDHPPLILSLLAVVVATGRTPLMLDALASLLNLRQLLPTMVLEQILSGFRLCEDNAAVIQRVRVVPRKQAMAVFLSSSFCECLVHTSENIHWEGMLQCVALGERTGALLNHLVRLGLDADCSFFPLVTLRTLPSESIWNDDSLPLAERKHAVGLLFRAGCNWLPERYHDPQNFFRRLGRNPKHMWRQFCNDLNIVLQPDDVRWQHCETQLLDEAFALVCPDKYKQMHGNCMVCDEPSLSSQRCGPGGCKCALCDECCAAYATNLHTTFGNDIVRCPTISCKKLLHPAFLTQLLQAGMLTDAQYRIVRRRQYRNMQLVKFPDWRFCTADCIGGVAIADVPGNSTYVACNFCFKTGCFKCGEQHALCDGGAQDAAFRSHLLAEGAKKGGKDRPCPYPNCGVVFRFDFGCNAVRCVQCKREWHW